MAYVPEERTKVSAPLQPWRVLVVDDEEDVHGVTLLALKRRTWRKRPFHLVNCRNAAEARETVRGAEPFHVALIDVVMETRTAGLELCQYLRTALPTSLRIILRTGQPGVAPEEKVLNDYDIDHYLAKSEVTPDRLFAAIRTCIRNSEEIGTVLAFHTQLREFSSAFQTVTSDEDLAVFMSQGLRFLELKHHVRVSFVPDIDGTPPDRVSQKRDHQLVASAHTAKIDPGELLSAAALGAEDAHIQLFASEDAANTRGTRGGFVVHAAEAFTIESLQNDLSIYVRDWTAAHNALVLRDRVARDKLLNERMYIERLDMVSSALTTLTQEVSSPLGVAESANAIVGSVAKQVREDVPTDRLRDMAQGLAEPSEAIARSIQRARRLLRTFEQFSVAQRSEERGHVDLAAVLASCVEIMSIDAGRQGVTLRSNVAPDAELPWVGYRGHLTQVIFNLVHDAVLYAYSDGGVLDIRLEKLDGRYSLELEDYGAGLPPHVLRKMADSGTNDGGSVGRIGLPLVEHIVKDLLQGEMTCTAKLGKGTKFVIQFPAVVPA
jgi:signal transduction histidine kinase